MAWRTLLLFTLLASALARDEFRDTELEMQIPTCGDHAISQLVEIVRALLPLKQIVLETQEKIQSMHNTTQEAKMFLARIRSDEIAMSALQEETKLLRREVATLKSQKDVAVAAARMQGRAAKIEVSGRCEQELQVLQLECVAKLMQLGEEAQYTMSTLKDENQNLTNQLLISEKQCNVSQEIALEELRSQNAQLESKLEGCRSFDSEYEDVKKKRYPKMSPGKQPKTESSVAKMPPTTYKHSCKGFNDSSAPVAPSPYETSVRIGNRQYLVGKERATWSEAWRICKARGMWVLTLETEQEQQQLEPHLMHMHHTPTDYWIFARKSPSNGLFSWECAESDFEPWRHQNNGEQTTMDGLLHEQRSQMRCAHIQFHRSEPAWSDSPCDAKINYICRKLVNECT